MVFNRAPAERQVQACRILFESVEQRPTVDAESDPHAVRNEVALTHESVSYVFWPFVRQLPQRVAEESPRSSTAQNRRVELVRR